MWSCCYNNRGFLTRMYNSYLNGCTPCRWAKTQFSVNIPPLWVLFFHEWIPALNMEGMSEQFWFFLALARVTTESDLARRGPAALTDGRTWRNSRSALCADYPHLHSCLSFRRDCRTSSEPLASDVGMHRVYKVWNALLTSVYKFTKVLADDALIEISTVMFLVSLLVMRVRRHRHTKYGRGFSPRRLLITG